MKVIPYYPEFEELEMGPALGFPALEPEPVMIRILTQVRIRRNRKWHRVIVREDYRKGEKAMGLMRMIIKVYQVIYQYTLDSSEYGQVRNPVDELKIDEKTRLNKKYGEIGNH